MEEYQLFPRFIDEDELEPGDIISLYDKLISIIDKDIDDYRSAGKREGWTTYGIFTALAGAVYAIFGITKGLNFENLPFPKIHAVTAFCLVLGHFLILLYGIKSGKQFEIKPKRLVQAKDFLKGLRLSFILRIAVISLSIVLVWRIEIPETYRIICTVLLALFAAFFAVYFGLSFSRKLKLGNLPQYQPVKTVLQILFVLGHLTILILIGMQIGWPVGDTLTLAWSLGLPLGAMVVLFEIWISSIPNEEVIRELNNLKDDLIFRDRSFNVVLARYAFLKEGITLLEMMRSQANAFLNEFASLDTIYRQQAVILERMLELFPDKKDKSSELKKKTDEVKVQQQSYDVLANEVARIISRIMPEFEKFKEELSTAAGQTGDYDQYNYIVKVFTDRLEGLRRLENETINKNLEIGKRLKELSPPDQNSNE